MSNTGRLLITALGMALLATCHQSILTAPPGSTLEMEANPKSIPANGGVSVITAIVYDATGQPAPDGTVVQFFTDLGRIPEQGKTNDGVARVNLVADGRSGEATVTGKIGGAETPTPTPTTPPSSTAAAGTSAPTLGSAATAATSSVAGSTAVAALKGEVMVKIGTSLPFRVVLAADPRNIASDAPRFSTLIATVLDEDGNPIANIPVVFDFPKDNTDTFEETLESGGQPRFTDNNGQARDRVFTSRPRGADTKTFDVEAQPLVGAAGGEGSSLKDTTTIGVNF